MDRLTYKWSVPNANEVREEIIVKRITKKKKNHKIENL